MADVTITRGRPVPSPLPPIESVTLKMTADEAIQLSALLGSFGGEYFVGEMFYNLSDKLEIDFCANDGDDMNAATDKFRWYARKASDAIAFRAAFLAKIAGNTKSD